MTDGRSVIHEGYEKNSQMSRQLEDALYNLPSDAQNRYSLYLLNGSVFNQYPELIRVLQNRIGFIGIASITDRETEDSLNLIRKAGVSLEDGLNPDEEQKLNGIHYFRKKNNRPYIVFKSGLTLDGKIATASHHSQWITNERTRLIDHRLRLRLRAIAAGHNTVRYDHPRFNCRIEGHEDKPVDRLIFASRDISHLFDSFQSFPGRNFQIGPDLSGSPENFIRFCNENEIDSILIEGGSYIYTWFLQQQLADRVILIYRPAFMGSDGIPVFRENQTASTGELRDFRIENLKVLDDNILLDLSRCGDAPDLLLENWLGAV
jgi:diaminohydroxyphosphoribosylaminopyrimidine deaminase/5-amino-6-(5-phosphoribosylamino)uracil reductase